MFGRIIELVELPDDFLFEVLAISTKMSEMLRAF